MVNYQNPAFQWAKLILGILMLVGVGLIGYKVVAPTSKDTYQPGSQGTSYETRHYALIDIPIGGCATWRAAVKEGVKK